MARKSYLVTDLGSGDGGKGGTVHKIATMQSAHTVIKVGGAQGSHGVCTSAGERFAFSQWGCGTLEGIPTFLSPRFVVSPEGLLNEAQMLRYGTSVHDPFRLLTVDERCLCATPYHGILSRLKELARGSDPRGTIGTGMGEATRYAERFPVLSLRAGDLKTADLRDRLVAIRDQVCEDLVPVMQHQFLPADYPLVEHELQRLNDDDFLEFIVGRFQEVAKRATIVDSSYFGQNVLARDGVTVVEGSHGILTDRFYGFHPHTNALRTLPRFTREMMEREGYEGKIVNIGVHRAYTIRHGAGPMPTANPSMSEQLLPGSHKQENRYQGNIRVGALDMPLLRYAIAACGGPSAFDGIALMWFDQIVKNGQWELCDRYQCGTNDRSFFDPSGELKVRHGEDDAQLVYTEALGRQLLNCIPDTTVCRIPPGATQEQLFELSAVALGERLGVAVRMLSLGPTEKEKVIK